MRRWTYIFLATLAATLVSCNDSFLDSYNQEELEATDLWQTEAHLASAANAFKLSLGGKEWIDKMESMADSSPWVTASAFYSIGAGNFTKDQKEIDELWAEAYHNIGRTNHFLANYERAAEVPATVRERYAAEAYFYRAYNYWVLTSLFGDVPYIDKELQADSPEVYRGRDPRAEIVAAVTRDLEEHYKALPIYVEAAGAEFGRVSQCAALALLSRIYLYNELWEEAADAAERAMANPYHCLYSTGRPDRDYADLFNYTGRASRNPENREVLLAYVYDHSLGVESSSFHDRSRECWRPDGFAACMPTQSMIDAYLTDEGEIWEPGPVTYYEAVFMHRDPRLAQSIMTPGEFWLAGKSGDRYSYDDKLYTYPKFIDDRTGCATRTGYYLRKFVEPSVAQYAGQDDNDVIVLRYAEVLLNYAEARCMQEKLTQEDLDRTINLLRFRAGMPALELDHLPEGSDLLTEIRRERRVELFAEGHRYFDIIRWRQGELLGQPLLGVRRDWILPVRVETPDRPVLDELPWHQVGKHEYLLMDAGRHFDPSRNYLLPIPARQEKLNPHLKPNNPGW